MLGWTDFHVLSEIYVALICHSDRLIWQVTVPKHERGNASGAHLPPDAAPSPNG
jgi:hypothetical protein